PPTTSRPWGARWASSWTAGPRSCACARSSSMRATADRLRRVPTPIVTADGVALEEADLVATHLVAANLAGHDSHGVGMIPTYVRHMHAGLVVPNTRAKIVNDDAPRLL